MTNRHHSTTRVEDQPPEDRWKTIVAIWSDPNHRWLFALVGFIVGLITGILIDSGENLVLNLFPEAVGILFTILIVDTLYRRTSEQQEIRRLLFQMRSNNNQIALQALAELGDRVNKGVLIGVRLYYANLQDARFFDADMRRIHLESANLAYSSFSSVDLRYANLHTAHLQHSSFSSQCSLRHSDLSGADLSYARWDSVDLREATLRNSNFTDANFSRTNFRESNLQGIQWLRTQVLTSDFEGNDFRYSTFPATKLSHTNLKKTNFHRCTFQSAIIMGCFFNNADCSEAQFTAVHFRGVDLIGVNFANAILEGSFDYNTTLPDGTRWTPDTDLSRFTNPQHPQFWRSTDPESPAFDSKLIAHR
jgi:uncharacterized protein YjbI with pentapeptide repeats